MPFIPTIESERNVSVGAPDVYANPNAFGAQIGGAIQDVGQSITQLTNAYQARARQEKADNQDVMLANKMAEGGIAFAKINAEAQTTAPADGTGVFQNTLEKQQAWIEDEANKIEDPVLRAQFRKQMAGRVVPYAENNIDYEAKRKVEFESTKADFALRGMENVVRTDANAYQQSFIDGNAIIESNKNIPASLKPAMKIEWGERLAFARFQGLLDSASTVEDYDAIEKELKIKKWQDAFKPQNYDGVLGQLAGARKTFMTQQSQTARALIDSAQEQVHTGQAPLANERVEEIITEANKSHNPTLISRAFRLQRDNQILVEGKKLPSSELDARANGIKGAGYPGMPDEVNKAIGAATTVFPSVPAAFFGGTARLEYGQYLRSSGRRGKPQYAPSPVHKGVDIRNVDPATVDALALAGELFGQPLAVTSGYRSQQKQNALRFAKGKNPYRATIAKDSQHTHGNAVDISTAGMSSAQKAKLFDSLLQSGFTAFGDYGSYIHADMRAAAPSSFNPQTGWLGWTKTTPEVINALTSRGYRAGMRAPPQAGGQPIDYGKGTTNGSTSAVGLYQSTNAMWLETMRDPAIAQRIGLPINLTDAQLLDLRKSEYWSTMAAGAYAEKNKKTLETNLGRPVTASELYMAHFLGAGGAQTLLSAYQNNPDAIAAQLMPQAAANNPGRFKDKSGRALTVKEVYDDITVAFATEPSQVQYEDAEMYGRMAKGRREQERNATMDTYSQNVANVNDLQEPGGFASRSAFVRAAADMYSMPISEVKPFTTDEADGLKRVAVEGTVSEKLDLMRNIGAMEQNAPGASEAAYSQLGLKDSVMQYAGEIANRTGDEGTASIIMRGQERLKPVEGNANAFHKAVFGDEMAVSETFASTVGRAFDQAPAGAYDAAFNAAKAYYAEKYGAGGFDAANFKQAVLAVTGQSENMADINGEPTIVPPGVDPVEFDRVVENLTDDDIIEFSENGMRPIDVNRDTVKAADISSQGKFMYIGDNLYKVQMLDGNFLVTEEQNDDGDFMPYIFKADATLIKQKATAPAAPPTAASGAPLITPTEPTLDPTGDSATSGGLISDEQRRKMLGP
jgi:hypothetical protein